MKFKPVAVGILGTVCVLILSYSDKINSVLEFFGIGGLGVVAIYIITRFFDHGVDRLWAWLGEKLGIKKPKSIDIYVSDERYHRLLEALGKNVQTLCQSQINEIQNGELKFIETLNWKITSKAQVTQFQGLLTDVIREYQGNSLQTFAVIGDAGVGKTSAIYSFILEWIELKKNDLIPVYFSLSTWKKNQSLEDWLTRELDRIYHLDKKIAEHFIKDFKIFPFLDGFDQMNQEMREKCIIEIYRYSRNNPLALTSRPKVFNEILEYLKRDEIQTDYLFEKYELQPLSAEQVKSITRGMTSNKAFEDVLNKSDKLKEFARYPMALFILSLVIHDFKSNEIIAIDRSSDDEIFHRLWKKYDEHVFNDKNFIEQRNVKGKSMNIRNWLRRIASEKDSSFYIEELQPIFLSGKWMKLQYYLFSRIAQCMCIAVSAGFFMSGAFDIIPAGILAGWVCAIVILTFKIKDFHPSTDEDFKLYFYSNNRRPVTYVKSALVLLMPLLVILCLFFGFSTPRLPEPGEMKMYGSFSMTETNVGFLIAILMALLVGFRSSWQTLGFDIRLVEKMSRDWKKFFKYGLIGGSLLGLFLIILAILLNAFLGDSGFGIWLREQPNIYLLAFLVGLIYGFCLFGMIGYLKEQDSILNRDEKQRIFTPNFGIKRTFTNAVKAGFFITIVMICLYGSFILIRENEITSIIKAFQTSIAFGILGFLWFGGLDVIGHYCLRWLIHLENSGPLNYIGFLEEASNLRFVRIVGSGYEFLHPTIRDYFLKEDFPTKKIRYRRTIMPMVCILLLIPIFYVLIGRFTGNLYWKSEISGLEVNSSSKWVKRKSNPATMLVIQGLPENDTLDLVLRASGKIKVGTFTGNVMPGGTEGGFFGMGINDTYDKPSLEYLQHGALAIRKKGDDQWRPFPDIDIYSIASDNRDLYLQVVNNDTVEFAINDREYHNNTGRFMVTVDTTTINKNTQIIAHRGGGGIGPENSLVAMKKSVEMNVNQIEVDIHLTKDNRLVVMHDAKVNRTTNGRGRIHELEADSIKSLSILSDPENGIVQVPFLEDVFRLVKPTGVSVLVEVKDPDDYPGIDEVLMEMVDKYEMYDQVEIFSFDTDFIDKLKKAYPTIRAGKFLISPFGTDKIDNVEAVGIYYHSLLLRKSFLTKMHERGIKVFAWSVNTQSGMQRLLEMKVDGIITDHPDLLETTMGF